MSDSPGQRATGQVSSEQEARSGLSLENWASRLAEGHKVVYQAGDVRWMLERLQTQEKLLQATYKYFSGITGKEEPVSSYAAEWLLDNFYVVQQALRQIREDMPEGYYRRLPKLKWSTRQNLPRVYVVAMEIFHACNGHLRLDLVTQFVTAYQRVESLTIGETWALPIMMRVIVLEYLTNALVNITGLKPPADQRGPAVAALPEGLEDETVVANAILSLRMLASNDWKAFFEEVSHVERILRIDPVSIYSQMDFETRDCYRKAIEDLSRGAGLSEVKIAKEVTKLARIEHSRGEADRRAHVGYYLMDAGRALVEERLNYRPSPGTLLRRWLVRHPTLFYLGSIGLLTLILMLGLVAYAIVIGNTPARIIVVSLLFIVPFMRMAVALVNWLLTCLLSPRVLSKLDFSDGIPAECRTIVVIPALLTDAHEVDSLLLQLERHYLGNNDPHLLFALLADFPDAPQKHLPGDSALIAQALTGLKALNERYARDGSAPFFFFNREREWNHSERVWMGWERKRGNLEEFTRLLLNKGETRYSVQVGALEILPEIKYVITLDADTVLPRESAGRLIAALAHPLNHAYFGEDGSVVAGYTVLQPRTEVKPTSASQSPFTKIFAGDIGLDLYTRAVSDVYQDLFGEGIYVGKGIYDLHAFERSLAGRVPENAVLSHDLLEGLHGRAGLVTDVVFLEDYPSSYLTYMHRLHRWVRGDWQLLPWLLSGRTPSVDEHASPLRLSLISRWKLFDNLCRSLLAPAMVALFIVSWFWLSGLALVWTLIVLFTPAVPLITGLAVELARRRPAPFLLTQATRWLLLFAFLPYEAFVMLHAILITLIRLAITRRHLLQWVTAAHAVRIFRKGPAMFWRRMWVAPLLAIGLGLPIALLNFPVFPVAAPLLFLWLISPAMAHRISRPVKRKRGDLTAEQLHRLRRLARRTWLYFEQFIGPDDHWLPPDHFQESPRGLVAHRTSITNIGLMLLSVLAAYDLGYIGMPELVLRIRNAFESMDVLERYRGHFLNWYETRSLEPLRPRYVSTVDSGNLAACLIALKESCSELSGSAVPSWDRWQALLDTAAVFDEIVQELRQAVPETVEPLRDHISDIQRRVLSVRGDSAGWIPLLAKLQETDMPELDRRLLALVEASRKSLDPAAVNSLRIWRERIRHHVLDMRREVETLLPWLLLLSQPPDLFRDAMDSDLSAAWRALLEALPESVRLDEITMVAERGRKRLDQLRERLAHAVPRDSRAESADEWCSRLAEALDSSKEKVRRLLRDYHEICLKAEDYLEQMKFDFLFDSDREIFYIGYNVDSEQLDTNRYDLLASEARTASLIAISKGDIPQSHWLHLSRPLTPICGTRGLLSWAGTMFEYLMPTLLAKQYENSLLSQSNLAAAKRQMEYGRQKGVPWGISESGYYRFDVNLHYQYRAFGVPGLGFKRGLGEDLVVAPYASLLAVSLFPQEVMQNVERLTEIQMLGNCGFYEAADYTPSRLILGQDRSIVRSFMSHHQSMILLSLINYFKDEIMVRRFHSDPKIQSAELLLQEQIPHKVPTEELPSEEVAVSLLVQPPVTVAPWQVPVQSPFPQAYILSNGSYSLLITSAGSGCSRWQEFDLTRWRSDTTLDDWGTWLYVGDEDTGELWSATYQPAAKDMQQHEVFFYPHKADFRCKAQEVIVHVEVTVSPEDDAEVRLVTLTNQNAWPRRLLITSYGEMTLAPHDADRRHPAFNKLFIESEYRREFNALLFRRRPRSAKDRPVHLAHILVAGPGVGAAVRYESERGNFLGRPGSPRRPAALDPEGAGLSGMTGATLDPIMALSQEIILDPYGASQIAFITAAAESEKKILALAKRYQDWAIVDRAFEMARSKSELELRQLKLNTQELERIQQMLSVLLYPYAAMRADPATLAANSEGQSGLWPYAISGDYPILLARIGREEETPLVQDLLRAHTYWRNRRLKIDLVILNTRETGYAQELQDQLHRLLSRTNNDVWLNQRGGIFLLRADQMSEAHRVLLMASARIILDCEQGSLAGQLEKLRAQPTYLPPFVPPLPEADRQDVTPPLPRPDGLLFDNGPGGFSPDGREYLIYLQPGRWTPAPWVNVVANPEFGFLVSEAGSGFSWAVNSGENRLSPWSNDPVRDPPGEALYLRDEETAAIWSPTPLPAGAESPYLVRHGAGYSVFEHHSHGLKQRVRTFVAPNAPVKFFQIRLENITGRTRRITVTYYVEWVLGNHREIMQQYILPEYHQESHSLLARNPYNTDFGTGVVFLAANREPHSLTTDRTEFLGRMGSLSDPAGLRRIGLAGTVLAGADPCAAIQLHVDLHPGESVEDFFLIGQGADKQEALRLIKHYQKPAEVEAAREAARSFWDDLLRKVEVTTPDAAMNLLLNRWLLYQDLSCRIWGRSAFYQSSGGFGFRDQLQDVMALMHAAPEIARSHILRAARHQFEAGDVLHWWHPPSGSGVRTRTSDDLLWLPLVASHYVTATGDDSILGEGARFIRGDLLKPEETERYGRYQPGAETYSLYEHCKRAIRKGTTAGPHGLPLIGSGDWNDGMNQVGAKGRGESIWLGWFLYAVLNSFAPICEMMNDGGEALLYREQADELRRALETAGWDGDWYLRAYNDEGVPIGSARSRECQIDSIAQSWAVLSEGGDRSRSERAMKAVLERLVRQDDMLVLLFEPPFDKTPYDPGYIKGYPPGIRENGGQYTHAALWAAWAFAKLGQGNQAENLFRLLNPVYHADTPEKCARYRVEPYVPAADIYSMPPHTGRGGWTWYTGSAGWMYRLGIEAMLGLRRSGNILRIDPCMPGHWPGCEIIYRIGEATYRIRIENPGGVSRGVKELMLDGMTLSNGEILLTDDKKEHNVHVLMG